MSYIHLEREEAIRRCEPSPWMDDSSRPRILLIDDSPAQLAALVGLLEGSCDLQVATSGERGLALARGGQVDMILLDMQMPGQDGPAVARALRDDRATCEVPFIFVTVDDTSHAEQMGLELGAIDYLTKPVQGEVALQRILNHLQRDRLRKLVEADRMLLEERVRQRTVELERARNEAMAASRLKDAILRNLSHELRTPLNGILGMLGILRRQTADESACRRLALAEQSARRLDEVLLSLLDLAQLEAGVLALNSAPFRLDEVVEDTVAGLRPVAAAKGLALEATADSGTRAVSIHGDRQRVQQILRELLLNAIKFTTKGAISLRAEVVEQPGPAGDEAAVVKVSVADSGPGVAPDRVGEIYEAFVQLDAARSRPAEGNGVGLALARGLARLMGGSVALETNSPTGATFALSLPNCLIAPG